MYTQVKLYERYYFLQLLIATDAARIGGDGSNTEIQKLIEGYIREIEDLR